MFQICLWVITWKRDHLWCWDLKWKCLCVALEASVVVQNSINSLCILLKLWQIHWYFITCDECFISLKSILILEINCSSEKGSWYLSASQNRGKCVFHREEIAQSCFLRDLPVISGIKSYLLCLFFFKTSAACTPPSDYLRGVALEWWNPRALEFPRIVESEDYRTHVA